MFTRPARNASSVIARKSYTCQICTQEGRRQPLAHRTSSPPSQLRCLQTTTQAEDLVPFRKLLKDEAKKRRRDGDSKSSKTSKGKDDRLEKWELTVGIEIHAELNTARKLFSEAATSVNETPNTHVALFDAAFPGSQPHFQIDTLLPALRAAIALQCDIQNRSTFDRKHYFYQDQPAGCQITQYYEPFARDGQITLYAHDGIAPEDGESITIGIKQIQMEQDTAKTVQQPPSTHLLDFNRVSHPLIEIITLPHIHHPSTAAVCVRKIQAILKQVNAVTAGMEVGGLRADVNVSVRERHREYRVGEGRSYYGVGGLGQRTEIKNLASVKAVEDAIIAERNRQIDILENGGVIEGETRGWTLGSTETKKLRGKEGEIDYRYMPDPDIPPIIVGQDVVQQLRRNLPMLPDEIAEMLAQSPEYGLTIKDAKTLILLDDGDRLDYYLNVVEILRTHFENDQQTLSRVGKVTGNWVLMELGGLFGNDEWSATRVPAKELASIILHVLRRQITGRTAKALLAAIFGGDGRTVEQIIAEDNLTLRPISQQEYVTMAQNLLDDNPDMVKVIKEKQQLGKIRWFVGQMIRQGDEGTVEAEAAESVLRELLQIPRGK